MDAIVIMAKEPRAGAVKTRLIPPLTAGVASELYLNFLLDKIDQVNSIENVVPYLAFYPASSKDHFSEFLPGNFHMIEQVGEDLGERLAMVSLKLFEIGYSKVILVDSDTPNLPTSYIKDGFISLDLSDVVIGPCEDGGYYLIGLRSYHPELFKDIPWSTSEVNSITQKKADALKLKTVKLKTWYDVDTYDDLKRLKMDIESSKHTGGGKSCCKNTYKILQDIF